jgi:hypothetical protein
MLSKRGIISRMRGVAREFLGCPVVIFHSIGLGRVVMQPSVRCIAVATSNSITSIVNIANTVISAVAMRSTYTHRNLANI